MSGVNQHDHSSKKTWIGMATSLRSVCFGGTTLAFVATLVGISANIRILLYRFLVKQLVFIPAFLYTLSDVWVMCNSMEYQHDKYASSSMVSDAAQLETTTSSSDTRQTVIMYEWGNSISEQLGPHPESSVSPFFGFMLVFVAAVTFPVWNLFIENALAYIRSKFLLRTDANVLVKMLMKPFTQLLSSHLALETISAICTLLFYGIFQYPSDLFWIPRYPSTMFNETEDMIQQAWNTSFFVTQTRYDIRAWVHSSWLDKLPHWIPDEHAPWLAFSPIDLPPKNGSPHYQFWQLTVSLLIWFVCLLYLYAIKSRTIHVKSEIAWVSTGVYWFANGFLSVYPVLSNNGLSVFDGLLMSLQMSIPVLGIGCLIDIIPFGLEQSFSFVMNTQSLPYNTMDQMIRIAIRVLMVLITVVCFGIPVSRHLGYALLFGTRAHVTAIETYVFEGIVLASLGYLLYVYASAIFWLYFQTPLFKIAWDRPSNFVFHRFGPDDSFLSRIAHVISSFYDSSGVQEQSNWQRLIDITSISLSELQDETIVLDVDLDTPNESGRDLRMAKISIQGGMHYELGGQKDLFQVSIGGKPKRQDNVMSLSDIHVLPYIVSQKTTVRVILTVKSEFFRIAKQHIEDYIRQQQIWNYFMKNPVDAPPMETPQKVYVSAKFSRTLSSAASIFSAPLPDISLTLFSATRLNSQNVWECTSDLCGVSGSMGNVQTSVHQLESGLYDLIQNNVTQVQSDVQSHLYEVDPGINEEFQLINQTLRSVMTLTKTKPEDDFVKKLLAYTWTLYKQVYRIEQKLDEQSEVQNVLMKSLWTLLRGIVMKLMPLIGYRIFSEAVQSPYLQGVLASSFTPDIDIQSETKNGIGITTHTQFLVLSALGIGYAVFYTQPCHSNNNNNNSKNIESQIQKIEQ